MPAFAPVLAMRAPTALKHGSAGAAPASGAAGRRANFYNSPMSYLLMQRDQIWLIQDRVCATRAVRAEDLLGSGPAREQAPQVHYIKACLHTARGAVGGVTTAPTAFFWQQWQQCSPAGAMRWDMPCGCCTATGTVAGLNMHPLVAFLPPE